MNYGNPIPWPLFEPDRSPFLFSAGDNLVNCLPVRDGWGPMPAFTDQTDALAIECRGAAFVTDTDGAVEIIAGTTTNLYRLNTSTFPFTWDELSKSTDAYSVPENDEWQFAVFGDFLIATQLGNPPQVYEIGSAANFADLGGSPPTAKHVWVAGDFLVFGWLENLPNTIQWSGVNDHTHWTIGRKGADQQSFPDGGGVQSGIGDQQGAIVIFRDKMRRMQFAPSSGYTFTFNDANSVRGTIARNSAVQIRDGDFVYLSEDGFFRGVEAVPIGAERVDRWLQENIDLTFIQDVQGAADPFNKIVWWRFARTDGTSALIGYDWQLDRWCYSNSDVRYLTKVASPGITIDGLDTYFATIDDVDVAFDSRFITGGRPTFGAFTSDNKLAFATGASLAATFRTAQLELNQNRRTFAQGFRVETDAQTYTGRIGSSDQHGETPSYTPSLSLTARGKDFKARKTGRLHTFEVTIPAGEEWTHISNVRPASVIEGHL